MKKQALMLGNLTKSTWPLMPLMKDREAELTVGGNAPDRHTMLLPPAWQLKKSN